MNSDHFKVKARTFDATTYKYIFQRKQYEALAKYCASLLIATDNSADA